MVQGQCWVCTFCLVGSNFKPSKNFFLVISTTSNSPNSDCKASNAYYYLAIFNVWTTKPNTLFLYHILGYLFSLGFELSEFFVNINTIYQPFFILRFEYLSFIVCYFNPHTIVHVNIYFPCSRLFPTPFFCTWRQWFLLAGSRFPLFVLGVIYLLREDVLLRNSPTLAL